MNINEIKQKILALRPRSAWSRAVQSDALDLLAEVDGTTLPCDDWAAAEKVLLNGASDWRAYSYGGCALVYNGDIARHYCTPSDLRRVTHADGTISERATAGNLPRF